MHFHNIFLVNEPSENKTIVINKVTKFLEPFNVDNGGGEWDWYQFGGRWMWSTLTDDNIDKIRKPGTNYYWNHYHDPEVKDKRWELKFPNGMSKSVYYGDDFTIKEWVDAHPAQTEVIDATDKTFFKKIDDMSNGSNLFREREFTPDGDGAWNNSLGFWNVTDNTNHYNKTKIMNTPKQWFLVNTDIHD